MKCYLIAFLSIPFLAVCQVGINTSSPKAQLDIVAISPDNPLMIDGLLIPRIQKFPMEPPAKDQHGMLVFLNSNVTTQKSGFYFWNNDSQKWEALSGNASENFYKPTTTVSPNNITDAIYRNGNIGIGTQDITSKLQIALNSTSEAAIKKGLEVDNNNPAVDNLTTYGIISDNRSATNGTKYGFKNNVGGIGTGIHYGIFNETYQNSGTNDIYGIYNRVGKTFGTNSSNYGVYSEIGQITGTGKIYGVYSVAYGSNPDKVYAGYFAGRVGIGNTPTEEYIFPATRGSNSQTLTLDSSGNMNWTYPNAQNYVTTGSATGDFVITEDVGTLRINNDLSQIIIPPANLNKGRIIRLIGWDGIGNKNFVFSNADNLYDVRNKVNVTGIGANQIFTIQSAGNRWILLNK
ncbi:hypothetical protein JM83_0103 [Gillisia sp. Hel_I_86]|uniref:hypothetical protein n=1 Tax=Gillisia sp. Hel_I_86 TaxID=1249981 RepID=UPI0011996BA8|nr:hypothetical protein [Gillisia sp. Hel_I_86]TVZ25202.1 hypothetical protein JM83_0103 [Gillisia sp. Hel_I_86]